MSHHELAFEMVCGLCPGTFKQGKISGQCLNLLRLKPNKCLMSGRLHEGENAFILISNDDEDYYTIRFGCYRFCHKIKTVQIGCISTNSHVITYHPNFEPLVVDSEPKMRISKKNKEVIVI